MQKNTEQKVFAYCEKHHMFKQGDSVVMGVSGGADSVCLLFVLLSLQKQLDLKLHVVHVNHGIRPDAGEDAAYVQSLCDKYEIPFTLVEKNIPKLAEELGCSEEEAGRRVRYQSFEQTLQKINVPEGCGRIAVAHNASDCAETMLFHLFRGTGLTGLGGIRPVRGQVVRPILCLEREEIEAYLEAYGVPFCHDSTNDSDDYTRNKIRHHILNYAEEEIVQGCVGNMMRTADILTETEDYIEEQVCTARETCVNHGGVDVQNYLKLHKVIQKRLLLALLKELSPQHKDMGAVHVEALHSLFVREGNRCVHLPYGIRGIREYGRVLLERMDGSKSVCTASNEPEGIASGGLAISNNPEFETRKEINIQKKDFMEKEPHIFYMDGSQWIFRVIIVPPEGINCKDIPQNQYTKWFDYDKIKERLKIRTRMEGDYFTIRNGGELRHKKLKDYMIDEKIPPRRRDEMLLLAEGEHILWLAGYRISEYYKVDTSTKRILQVSCEPDNG